MRQAGIIAAAGLYAVKNNIGRLRIDHENAQVLARMLNGLSIFEIDFDRVQTNIVIAKISGPLMADEVLAAMKKAGVLAVPFGPKKIRFVTHLDVSRDDCEEAVGRIADIYGSN